LDRVERIGLAAGENGNAGEPSFGIIPDPKPSTLPGSPHSFFCWISRTIFKLSPTAQARTGLSNLRPGQSGGYSPVKCRAHSYEAHSDLPTWVAANSPRSRK
jgi:hypothetical protein